MPGVCQAHEKSPVHTLASLSLLPWTQTREGHGISANRETAGMDVRRTVSAYFTWFYQFLEKISLSIGGLDSANYEKSSFQTKSIVS